jgi:hypothetical protein
VPRSRCAPLSKRRRGFAGPAFVAGTPVFRPDAPVRHPRHARIGGLTRECSSRDTTRQGVTAWIPRLTRMRRGCAACVTSARGHRVAGSTRVCFGRATLRRSLTHVWRTFDSTPAVPARGFAPRSTELLRAVTAWIRAATRLRRGCAACVTSARRQRVAGSTRACCCRDTLCRGLSRVCRASDITAAWSARVRVDCAERLCRGSDAVRFDRDTPRFRRDAVCFRAAHLRFDPAHLGQAEWSGRQCCANDNPSSAFRHLLPSRGEKATYGGRISRGSPP